MTTLDPYTFGNRPPILLTEVDRLRLRALVDTATPDDPIVRRFCKKNWHGRRRLQKASLASSRWAQW